MKLNSDRLQFLLEKYLENACTAQEIDELLQHVHKFPDDPVLHQMIDADALHEKISNDTLPDGLSASLRKRILENLSNSSTSGNVIAAPPQRWLLKVAAVLIPLIGCLAVIYFQLGTTDEVIITTSFGEVKTITLPDNSKVVLNGNSTLRYAKSWDTDADREVMLQGEGFFTVVHQPHDQKFRVQTSNEITIDVLGTEFNVNDRTDRIQVVLQSGKIKLGMENTHAPHEIVMHSGDYVEVNHDGRVTRKQVDTKYYTAWQKSKLVFHDTTLRDILLLLRDNYGYTINISDSLLLRETFTATYPADDIAVLLKALQKSFRISIDTSEKEISVRN